MFANVEKMHEVSVMDKEKEHMNKMKDAEEMKVHKDVGCAAHTAKYKYVYGVWCFTS